MQKRLQLCAALLLVLVLALAGCTSRAGLGSTIERDPDDFYVDLPAVVIDYAPDGTASVGGLSHMELGYAERPGGVRLPTEIRFALANALYGMGLPSLWVQHFTATNVQHMQVNSGADGIFLMVNGRRIPSLVWEEGSLVATSHAVTALGIGVPTLNKALPLVQKLGMGLVLRFPVAEGNELIPFTGVEDSEEVALAKVAQAQILKALGGALPTLEIPILYHPDGSWTLGELSDASWSALTNAPLFALRLPPAVISGLTDSGINTVGLQTDHDGIHIFINGTGLPYLSWGSGEIENVLSLSKQLGVVDTIAGIVPDYDVDSVLVMVEGMLPIIQATSANVTIYLPDSGMGN